MADEVAAEAALVSVDLDPLLTGARFGDPGEALERLEEQLPRLENADDPERLLQGLCGRIGLLRLVGAGEEDLVQACDLLERAADDQRQPVWRAVARALRAQTSVDAGDVAAAMGDLGEIDLDQVEAGFSSLAGHRLLEILSDVYTRLRLHDRADEARQRIEESVTSRSLLDAAAHWVGWGSELAHRAVEPIARGAEEPDLVMLDEAAEIAARVDDLDPGEVPDRLVRAASGIRALAAAYRGRSSESLRLLARDAFADPQDLPSTERQVLILAAMRAHALLGSVATARSLDEAATQHVGTLTDLVFEVARARERLWLETHAGGNPAPVLRRLTELLARLAWQGMDLVTDTARQSLEHHVLRAESRTDALTGVGNRRALDEELRAMLRDGPLPMALVLVDLDGFAQINDRYTELVGDEVLRRVATALAQQLRMGDRILRSGGDEFVLLLPGTADQEVRQVADRMGRAIARLPWSDLAEGLRVGITTGFSSVWSLTGRRPDRDAEVLLQRAEEALSAAKAARGRDRAPDLLTAPGRERRPGQRLPARPSAVRGPSAPESPVRPDRTPGPPGPEGPLSVLPAPEGPAAGRPGREAPGRGDPVSGPGVRTDPGERPASGRRARSGPADAGGGPGAGRRRPTPSGSGLRTEPSDRGLRTEDHRGDDHRADRHPSDRRHEDPTDDPFAGSVNDPVNDLFDDPLNDPFGRNGQYPTGPTRIGPTPTGATSPDPGSSRSAPTGPGSSRSAPAGPTQAGPTLAGPTRTGSTPAGPTRTGSTPAGPARRDPAPTGSAPTGSASGWPTRSEDPRPRPGTPAPEAPYPPVTPGHSDPLVARAAADRAMTTPPEPGRTELWARPRDPLTDPGWTDAAMTGSLPLAAFTAASFSPDHPPESSVPSAPGTGPRSGRRRPETHQVPPAPVTSPPNGYPGPGHDAPPPNGRRYDSRRSPTPAPTPSPTPGASPYPAPDPPVPSSTGAGPARDAEPRLRRDRFRGGAHGAGAPPADAEPGARRSRERRSEEDTWSERDHQREMDRWIPAAPNPVPPEYPAPNPVPPEYPALRPELPEYPAPQERPTPNPVDSGYPPPATSPAPALPASPPPPLRRRRPAIIDLGGDEDTSNPFG